MDTAELQKPIREYYEELLANKFDNLNRQLYGDLQPTEI